MTYPLLREDITIEVNAMASEMTRSKSEDVCILFTL